MSLSKHNGNKPKLTLADFFVPSYEDVIETGLNGEEFISKALIIPPGFLLFIILMLVWFVESC